MVVDNRPISERAQPDAYKLAARHESLYILIVADDNNGVALLFLVFLSVNSLPFLFPPFHLFSTRITRSQIRTLGTNLSSESKIKEKKAVSKEEFFSLLCILLFVCIFNRRLNNKSHKLIEKDKYTLEKSSQKRIPLHPLSLFHFLSFSVTLFHSLAASSVHFRDHETDSAYFHILTRDKVFLKYDTFTFFLIPLHRLPSST